MRAGSGERTPPADKAWVGASGTLGLTILAPRMTDVSESEPALAPERPTGLSGLLRHSATYSLVPVLGRAISLVMVFFFAEWMREGEFGAVDLADLLLAALVQLLGYNLLQGMTRYYFDHEEVEDRKRVVASVTLALGGISAVVIGVMLLFVRELTPILISGESLGTGWTVRRVTTVALLIIPFQLTTQCGLYYLQILKRSGTFAAIQLTKLVFELSLRVWMVGFAGYGAPGYLYPVLIGEVILTVLLTGWTLRRTGLHLSWRVLRPIVLYTLPLVPVGVFQLLLHYGDRRLLEMFSPEGQGLYNVGIYGIGYKIGFLTTTVVLGPFVQIFHPWIYGEEDPERRALNLSRVSTYGILAITAASVCIVLIAREVLFFMPPDKDYVMAWKVVPWITSAYLLWSIYHLSQIPLYIAKRTGRLVWINGLAVLANVGLNAWLVPRFGYVGSGQATLITFALLAGMGLHLAHQSTSVPFELGRIALCLGAMAAASWITLQIDARFPPETAREWLLAVGYKTAIALTLVGLLWRVVLHADERERLRQWLGRMLERVLRKA